MQKRSNRFEIRYAPIALDEAFPILSELDIVQRDHPIRYLHVHQCLEIGLCFEGSGVFVVGEKVLPFSAGDVSFINHTEVHLARSAAGTTSKWAWIYFDPLRLVDLPDADRRYLDPSPLAGGNFANIIPPGESAEIAHLARRLVEEMRGQAVGYRSIVRGLVLELMVLTHRLRKKALRGPAQEQRSGYERIAPALQIIARDYASPLRIRELARSCGVSEPGLRRLFHQAVGRSPRDYWNGLRLRMAASQLRTTTHSVLEISQASGFETLSSFNRLFRTHFGVSPREWRKQEDA